MGYTDHGSGGPNFIVDYNSMDRVHGRQIGWDAFDATNPNHAPFFKTVNGCQVKCVPAGTIMVERVANQEIVPRLFGNGKNGAEYIMITGASENDNIDAMTGYGVFVGGVVMQNLLPDWWQGQDPANGGNGAFATWRGELQSNLSTGFRFEGYNNNA